MRSKLYSGLIAGNTLPLLAIILKINKVWGKTKENQNIKYPTVFNGFHFPQYSSAPKTEIR